MSKINTSKSRYNNLSTEVSPRHRMGSFTTRVIFGALLMFPLLCAGLASRASLAPAEVRLAVVEAKVAPVVPGLMPLVTFSVTNTNDSGAGSLRDAINQANGTVALDTINFNIPSSDPNCVAVPGHGTVCTISLSTQVDIVFPVVINGYTQPGTSPNTNPITMGSNAVLLIELRSPHPPGSQNSGLVFGSNSSGSTVRGLVMNRFSSAISFNGNDNSIVEGNFLGTDPRGTVARPNLTGVQIIFSADNNTVGGTSPGARNVISSNASVGVDVEVNSIGNVVQGNFIGTSAAGNAALGNFTGVRIGNNSLNTLIGGDTVSARNVIVPSLQGVGIDISNTHSGVNIRGNFIGTDINGMTRLENSSTAINMLVTTGIVVGGATATPGMPPGNLIVSGFFAIDVTDMPNLTVQGNLIGTDITGAVLPPGVRSNSRRLTD